MTTAIERPVLQGIPAVRSSSAARFWWVPLAVVIIAEIMLSARLIPEAPLPSGDEGRYIYGGHQLIYELWNGGGSPYYETWFSGSPVLYPILAATADHYSGLVGVRLMSLTFMVTATIILFVSSRRLFGYCGALTAAGLFAGLGLTQDLGVYATYDALAILTLAVATYCALRTGDSERYRGRWLLAVPAALLAANAIKYMTVAFDPVVVGLAALQVAGWRRVVQRGLVLGLATLTLLVLAVALAGRAYLQGIMFTTLDRQSGRQQFLAGATIQPERLVLAESWRWIGSALALCLLALLLAAVRRDRRSAVLAVLMFGTIIVTLEALHLHSDQSMRKHDDFSAWFACMGAAAIPGYLPRPTPTWARAMLAAVLVAAPSAYTTPRALQTYPGGRGTNAVADAVLRPYLRSGGRYLIGGIDNEAILYWDYSPSKWFGNFDDIYIKYPIPGRGGDSHGQRLGLVCFSVRPGCMYLEGVAGYRAAIEAHWFALISLVGGHVIAHHKLIEQDYVIEQAAESTPGYVLISYVGGAPTWIYAPDYEHFGRLR